MRYKLRHHLLFFFVGMGASVAMAQGDLSQPMDDSPIEIPEPRTMLVVEYQEQSPEGSKLFDAIAQAKREFEKVESVVIPDIATLETLLEGRTDIGLVVLVYPGNIEAVMKLPSLYPDIFFTLIDAPLPSYAANLQSVEFKKEQGIFLLGAIAAMRSHEPMVVMALEESERSRSMADYFTAGVHHINPKIKVERRLDVKPTASQRTRLSSTIDDVFQRGTNTLFSMDDEIIVQALRAAKPEQKLVLSSKQPPATADTTRLMTYMVKRYDLALLDVLRIYTHKQWHAGKIELGVSGGYVDYSLTAENLDLFPKESIDRIEAIKDYLSQGMVEVTPSSKKEDD